MRAAALVAVLVATVGCAAAKPIKPVRFPVSSSEVAYDAALRAVVAEGFSAETMERSAGVIQTNWREVPTTIVMRAFVSDPRSRIRLVVVIDSDVATVRSEAEFCSPYGCQGVDGEAPETTALVRRVARAIHTAKGGR